ncbi:MAG: hypothetical protein O7G87_17535 [bacterium]|nr:hypothetical protein [bacterium]
MKKSTFLLLILLLLIQPVQGLERGNYRAVMQNVQARFNRVEGLFTGYRLNMKRTTLPGLTAHIQTGFGFHAQQFHYQAGLDYQQPKYTLSAAAFDRTETNDKPIISVSENSFFSLLFKGDYRDYYRAKNGFEIKGAYRYRPRLLLFGRFITFSYHSMPVEHQWSIFRNSRTFRDNPAVRPGTLNRIQAGFLFQTRRSPRVFLNAWTLSGEYERGFREFDYNGLILAAKRHQKTILGNQVFILQARLATRSDTAEQNLFDLGGVGTLRGYGIKEFTGNRMLMFNIDYLFQGDLLGKIPLKGFHLANLILFFDTGWTTLQPKSESFLTGFQDLRLSDFKSNLGLAIGITERLMRINIARRLDRGNDAWTVSVRFLREL